MDLSELERYRSLFSEYIDVKNKYLESRKQMIDGLSRLSSIANNYQKKINNVKNCKTKSNDSVIWERLHQMGDDIYNEFTTLSNIKKINQVLYDKLLTMSHQFGKEKKNFQIYTSTHLQKLSFDFDKINLTIK